MVRSSFLRVLAVGAVGAMVSAGCGDGGASPLDEVDDEVTVEVRSDDLQDGGEVPVQFTCDGEDVPPSLIWSGLPDETEEVAVVVDDPDAPGGTFTHWTVWGLTPADSLRDDVPEHAVEGNNDFGRSGYGGPCPPPGEPHQYRFRVLALDTMVALESGAPPSALAEAIDGYVVGEGVLEATFGR